MGSNKLVVFHIPKWYPNRYDSLLGIFVKRHILCIMPGTTQVVLYAMVSSENKQWLELEESNEDGIITYRCYYRKKITGIDAIDKLIKMALYFFSILKMYSKAKKKFGKPDIIQAHVLLRTAFLSYLIGLIERRPYFILEHATRFTRQDISTFRNSLDRFMTAFVVKQSKGIIAVSLSLANAIKNKCHAYQQSFYVIYNCVDTSIFHPTSVIESDKKKLVYVAELNDAAKNVSGLLNVIAELSKERDDFIVHIVGYGKDEALLQRKAELLGLLNQTVVFMGKKTGAELSKIMGDAKALLLFSNYENLPCVITEAFCCGTPVISTSVGGIDEIVNQYNGMLIPKGDEAAMLNCIEKLLNNQVSYDQQKIAADANALFSNEHIGRAFMKIYQEA